MSKCIIVVGHLSNEKNYNVLKDCVDYLRLYGEKYPIVLAMSGFDELLCKAISLGDQFVFTNYNTIMKQENQFIDVYVSTDAWTVTEKLGPTINSYAFAQIQKLDLALRCAIAEGYTEFLVLNYDVYTMDSKFIEYAFSQPQNVFVKLKTPGLLADAFKLNMVGANMIRELVDHGPVELFNKFPSNGKMLEEVLGEAVNYFLRGKDTILLPHDPCSPEQIVGYKVLINNNATSSSTAHAYVDNGTIYVVVTGMGHPKYTLDGVIEIGYNGTFTKYDVGTGLCYLHPLCLFENKDVEFDVKTSFGQFKVPIRTESLNRTVIEWKNR